MACGFDYYRGTLRALAFQTRDLGCVYLPDASETSRDKINVRDGHYPLWGRMHLFNARTNGRAVSEAAQALVALLTRPDLDIEILDTFIDAGFGYCEPTP